MKAGRELDALVAEKVMEWKKWHWPLDTFKWVSQDPSIDTVYADDGWSPSISIADAWMVVEKMKEIDRHFILWTWSNIAQVIDSEIDGKDYYADEKAEEIPEAICLAALKAVGA